MKFTRVRTRRRICRVEISLLQWGHLKGDSGVYSASKAGVGGRDWSSSTH